MALQEDLAEIGGLDSGVDLSGVEKSVAQQFLDVADIGSVLEHVGGAGVANTVDVDVFFDSDPLGYDFEGSQEGRSPEPAFESGEKESRRAGGAKIGTASLEIGR